MKINFQALEFIARMSGRERVMVIVSVGSLLLFVLQSIFLSPLFEKKERLDVKIEKDVQDLLWMYGAVGRWSKLSSGTVVKKKGLPKGRSLLSVIDSTVKRFDLAKSLRRIEPEGKDGVRLYFEGGRFGSIVKWLGMVERKYGAVVVQMNVSANDGLGRVNARILLQIEKRL